MAKGTQRRLAGGSAGDVTVDGRHRLAAALIGEGRHGSFSAAQTMPADNLHIEVQGLGPLEFPVHGQQAGQLCMLGRPARYGKGERTLVDPAVRNTWEIPTTKVKIDKRRWDRTLVPVIERLRADLGLPDGCRLEAGFHSMLVYGPGHFFVPHQDSEKDDSMVGSLVVTLPSAFTGGVLEVEHRGEVATYRGSKKAVSFVGFYSDCRHQVKPVRSGHRIVLTYNLMLCDDRVVDVVGTGDTDLVNELAGCIDDHFTAADAPSRLVYLLDHEYTPRGLSWSHLKGVDARCVSLLRAGAEQARCEATLALIDIHETWSAFEPEAHHHSYGRSGYRHWVDWDDDDDDDPDAGATDQADADDYELDEMIESDVTLDSWLGSPEGTVEKVGLTIGEDELCASTDTEDLTPYASEYEGYMGNWGNTLDRWYHRGALVIWPKRLDFAVRAEASPSRALDALAVRVRRGDVDGARTEAVTLGCFWEHAVRRVEAKGLITKAMRTARLLEDSSSASMLLKPFSIELLTSRHAKPLSGLADAFGEHWMADLVDSWSRGRRYSSLDSSTTLWITSMQGLCAALANEGDPGRSVAVLLVRDSWTCLRTMIEQALGSPSSSHRETAFARLGPAVGALVDGASMAGAADIVGEVSGFVCRGDDVLVDCAVQVLRAVPAQRWVAAGLGTVANHCLQALEVRLARPLRAVDDWSIVMPAGCHCELCSKLAGFLVDPSLRDLEWPLAKDKRSHIHHRIDAAELPVRHETRRKGSPFTLVLTKTSALFQRDKRARLRDQADRAWIIGARRSRLKR